MKKADGEPIFRLELIHLNATRKAFRMPTPPHKRNTRESGQNKFFNKIPTSVPTGLVDSELFLRVFFAETPAC